MRALGMIVVALVVGAILLRFAVRHWYLPWRQRKHFEALEAESKRLDEFLDRERIPTRRK